MYATWKWLTFDASFWNKVRESAGAVCCEPNILRWKTNKLMRWRVVCGSFQNLLKEGSAMESGHKRRTVRGIGSMTLRAVGFQDDGCERCGGPGTEKHW